MMSFGPGFLPSATKGHPVKINETEKTPDAPGTASPTSRPIPKTLSEDQDSWRKRSLHHLKSETLIGHFSGDLLDRGIQPAPIGAPLPSDCSSRSPASERILPKQTTKHALAEGLDLR